MKYTVRIGEKIYQAEILDLEACPVVVMVDGQAVEVWPVTEADPGASLPTNSAALSSAEPVSGKAAVVPEGQPSPARSYDNNLRAPLPGVILEIRVSSGDEVTSGQELFVIEAMKMRNTIRSTRAGVVAAVHVQTGQTVNHNERLLEFVEQGGNK